MQLHLHSSSLEIKQQTRQTTGPAVSIGEPQNVVSDRKHTVKSDLLKDR